MIKEPFLILSYYQKLMIDHQNLISRSYLKRQKLKLIPLRLILIFNDGLRILIVDMGSKDTLKINQITNLKEGKCTKKQLCLLLFIFIILHLNVYLLQFSMINNIIGRLQIMESTNQHFSTSSLDTKTVLILFVEIVFIMIYLISLLLIVIRRAKKFIVAHNKKYYLIIFFYIVTKLVLSAILIVKVIVGMANQWSNIEPSEVEIIVKTSLVLANFSAIELFLVALEVYLSHCFSVVSQTSSKRCEKMLLLGLKIMQVMIAFFVLIPLVVFDINELGYSIINGLDISLNLIIIISFLITFFYMNFKMTGIMMENKLNQVIKKIYKVQLIILVSRAVALVFQVMIALYVLPNTFQEEVNTFTLQYEIVLALIFLGSVLFLLLTEGLPIMYSLRSGVVQALNYRVQPIIKQNLEESLIDNYKQINQSETTPHKQLKMKNFSNLSDIKAEKEDTIWTCKRGDFQGKSYMIRISKNQISNYIFEDIENQVAIWNQLNLKYLSKISYFCQGEIIHFVQKYYNQSLDKKVNDINSQSQIIRLAIELAQAIRQLHEKDIVHGCLTPRHIFTQESYIILNGIGLNSLKKYLSLITGYTNKSIYTAIQHLKDKSNVILKPKKPADIYSFGIIFYQMITKNKQYRQLTLKDIQVKFVEENFRPKLPQHIKLQVKNLIRRCWHENVEKRPTIDEVIQTLRRIS